MFINHPNDAVQKNWKNWNCYLSNFKDYLISFDPACIAIARERGQQAGKSGIYSVVLRKKKKKKKKAKSAIFSFANL